MLEQNRLIWRAPAAERRERNERKIRCRASPVRSVTIPNVLIHVSSSSRAASMFSPIFAKKTKLLRTQYTKSEAIRECFKLTRGFAVGQRVCFVHSIQRTLAEPSQGKPTCLFCLHWVNTRVRGTSRHQHNTHIGTNGRVVRMRGRGIEGYRGV